jgi:hypothetical protein
MLLVLLVGGDGQTLLLTDPPMRANFDDELKVKGSMKWFVDGFVCRRCVAVYKQ